MDRTQPKPKLVFFQFKYGKDVPGFLLRHRDEHVRCLAQWFDVTVIRDHCDFQRVCEEHEPEIAVFETGVQLSNCERLNISHVRGFDSIPRVGFLNADAWGETREGILSDLEHWGIETSFSIAVTAAEHTPSIAKHLFSWPNFIDDNVFRDYGSPKVVPIFIAGSQDPQYPWRHKVYKALADQFPSLVCPHGGYGSRAATRRMMHGEPYARAINASFFAPACGTVAKEVVRKHFEIPGCKTCLITEESPGLKAAGFVDMKNCIFTDGGDAAEKVTHLLGRPDDLEKICEAGHRLVHSRHTARERDQIYQWFLLQKQLRPDEQIVQAGPFEPLTVVKRSLSVGNCHIASNGLHLQLLRKGDASLQKGDYDAAERYLIKCLNYTSMLPEAKLKLAVCSLHRGDARTAVRHLIEPIRYTITSYRAPDPDPVEWAYFIIGLICLGKLREAKRRANQFVELHHPELDRARWVVDVLTTGACLADGIEPKANKARSSLHQLPEQTVDAWIQDVCQMLSACGRSAFAERLQAAQTVETTGTSASDRPGKQLLLRSKATAIPFKCNFRRRPTLRGFDNPLIYNRLWERAVDCGMEALHGIERRCGYFLPYSHSSMRDDDWFRAVRSWARNEAIGTALIMGAVYEDGGTQAFLAGASKNEMNPVVFCVGHQSRRDLDQNKDRQVMWYGVTSEGVGGVHGNIIDTIALIRERHGVSRFDAVLIQKLGQDCGTIPASIVSGVVRDTRVIMLDAINTPSNYATFQSLLSNRNYSLSAYDIDQRDGYAIFVRKEP
jgi:hypothetical protein